MIKWLTNRFQSTSATEVNSFFPPQPGKQCVIRRLMHSPTHASDALAVYVAKPDFVTLVTRDATPTQSATHIYIDVDVAAGHVVKGHTLTANDYLVIATGTGYVLANPSGVADVTGETYCDVTVASITTAAKAGDKVYVVRAADIVAWTTGGTSAVTYENFIAGNIGCPLVFGATSAGSNNNTNTAVAEYL